MAADHGSDGNDYKSTCQFPIAIGLMVETMSAYLSAVKAIKAKAPAGCAA
jgi:hypothetical protein